MSAAAQPRPPDPAALALDERMLARAFTAFTEAAASLERSYRQLQAELVRLRHELEETNRDLAGSLEENRRMRLHLNRILEGLPCGVLVAAADGSLSTANPEALRLLGAVSGQPLESLDRVPLWADELLQDARHSAAEREHRCQGGELEWIAVRHAALDSAAGGDSVFILRDISEAKRLQQTQEALGRRQALAEMSALLAHEVRNPLGSLELFTGLLAESQLSREAREWVAQLQAGLRTLAATVNNVLHFHGQPPPQRAPIDLGQKLRSLEQFLRPLAAQVRVRLALEQRLDGVVAALDSHQFEQVMLNLALNAFRLMQAGGSLKITGRESGSERRLALIEITDSAKGIPAENLERIFQPGFSTRAGSPGLGLAVCKTIIEQHGGAIRVASRAGAGTTFQLELPLGEATP